MTNIKLPSFENMIRIIILLWTTAIISILWIDKPLAIFIHAHHFDQLLLFNVVTNYFLALLTLILIVIIFIKYWQSLGYRAVFIAIYFYLTQMMNMEIKNMLKIVFGRYWPKTWFHNNLSLIHDGVFGFNWWHGYNNFSSFPSGHSTYLGFCFIWFIVLMPKLRWLGYIFLFILPFSLIILDYHFLGDCLAGLSLGFICSYLSFYLLNKITAKIQ
jgi:membrane-associated phospholipid phosphatase